MDRKNTEDSANNSVNNAQAQASSAAGHWVLARAGKRVLRPGGLKLTQQMLENAHIAGCEVVEFAPGLGRTAQMIVKSCAGYVGVEQNPSAALQVQDLVRPYGGCVLNADAQSSGLSGACADVVVGEAMLTMQNAKAKAEIVAEARRILRAGGRYAIHELALVPDDISPEKADELRKTLAQTIKVNARPLTVAEWQNLLSEAGFVVEWTGTAPMALLSPRRNLSDEGIFGVLRIMKNLIKDRELRERVLKMRSIFTKYKDNLAGVAIVARLPYDGERPEP